MKLERFRERMDSMWAEIPDELREGVDAISVEEETHLHPDIEGVFTLAECLPEEWPSQYGGPDDSCSHLVLYHGSFQALAKLDPTFDWELELHETILHELLHHREASAGEHGLETFDWAVEQNQRRHAGKSFDPAFYRALPSGTDGTVRIESDIFVESCAGRRREEARFGWRGRSYSLRVPPNERPAFVRVRNLARGRLWVVVREARPWWKTWLPAREVEPTQLERGALPDPEGGKGRC